MPTESAANALVRFGTSSFSSGDWVGPFYPDGTPPSDFLRYYATEFDTVEIDATYYAIPSAATVDGWAEKTPEHFLIAAKFPRSIVHGGEGSRPDPETVLDSDSARRNCDRFLEVIGRLGPRLGPLVLQFPYFAKAIFPSSKPFMERLDRFLENLPQGFRYAVEIRNGRWLTADFVALCRRHEAAVVLVDQGWMPMPDELAEKFDPISADFAYIRLLGDRREIEAITKSWEREVIDRGEKLQRWANYLAGLADLAIPTLVYINNHYAGHAPATVRRLQEMFRSARDAPSRS